MMTAQIWLTKGAFALYAASTALAFTYLFLKDEKWGLSILEEQEPLRHKEKNIH